MKHSIMVTLTVLAVLFISVNSHAGDKFRIEGVIAPVIVPANLSISTETNGSFTSISEDGRFYISQNLRDHNEDLRTYQFEVNLSGERIYTVVVF